MPLLLARRHRKPRLPPWDCLLVPGKSIGSLFYDDIFANILGNVEKLTQPFIIVVGLTLHHVTQLVTKRLLPERSIAHAYQADHIRMIGIVQSTSYSDAIEEHEKA